MYRPSLQVVWLPMIKTKEILMVSVSINQFSVGQRISGAAKAVKYWLLWSSLFTLLLSFTLHADSNNAQTISSNEPVTKDLTFDGHDIVLNKGEKAYLKQSLNSTMLLLVSNISPIYAGARVDYSLSVSGKVSMRDLKAGEPSPQLWPNNWQGSSLSVTNVSANDNAMMQVNLYGVSTSADLSLSKDYSEQSLPHLKSVGTTIAGNSGHLLLRAPHEEARFVIFLGDKMYTYTVNTTTDSSNGDNIKTTKNNSLSLAVEQKSGQTLLIINASRTATAAASVSYRLLTQTLDESDTTTQ